MEEYSIYDCNGINGYPLLGDWDVKEGLARKIESTFRAYSLDIDYPIKEKTSKIFEPFVYYSFILVERREKEVKHTAFEILDFLYELLPLSESAMYYGEFDSRTLFCELIEDIIGLISEHYIESPSNKYHNNYLYAIGKLEEWMRAYSDSNKRKELRKKRFEEKLRAFKEQQGGESNVSTTENSNDNEEQGAIEHNTSCYKDLLYYFKGNSEICDEFIRKCWAKKHDKMRIDCYIKDYKNKGKALDYSREKERLYNVLRANGLIKIKWVTCKDYL